MSENERNPTPDYNFLDPPAHTPTPTPDYSFVDPPAPSTPDNPGHLYVEHTLLVAAGRKIDVLSLRTGKNHPVLQAMATNHAIYQARYGIQGHQDWDHRVKELYRDMPDCGTFSEVANESWPDQDAPAAADEMYISWRKSPGHWSAVNGVCSFWGYAMSYNAGKKIWYVAGCFAQLRNA